MASGDVREREERGTSREVPWAGWAGGPVGRPEGMHIHVHLAEGARPGKRRAWLAWGGGVLAVALAFGAGQLSASRPGNRTGDLELPADLALLRRMGPLTPPAATSPGPPSAAGQLPGALHLPPALQQQLAQPPRIVPPSPARAATPQPAVAQPGAPPRNAFGLER